jgi:hypothetical protein
MTALLLILRSLFGSAAVCHAALAVAMPSPSETFLAKAAIVALCWVAAEVASARMALEKAQERKWIDEAIDRAGGQPTARAWIDEALDRAGGK